MHALRSGWVPLLVAAVLGAVSIGFPIVAKPLPRLVYNATASAPLGFYRLLPGALFGRGDLVLAWLPQSAANLAAIRDYLPLGIPAVKRVAALDDDLVCLRGGVVTINNRIIARALSADSEGRPLIAWQGCRPLAAGEIFLLNADVQSSFDGRYFGPISAAAIIGRLVPLWTW
jgi:conjugative transfer signal peptidase TraF